MLVLYVLGTTILMLFAVAVVGQALTPSTFFTNVDKERLKTVFKAAKPYGSDMESMHYSILGFSLIGSMEEPYVSAFLMFGKSITQGCL